ncbi:MAG: lactate racemase domain-containing protein [Dehalococcoidales bacterium]|nr:lactate racemase domain-containing protein [Dehalococcoidales bacterium]
METPDYPRSRIPNVALVRRHFTSHELQDVEGELRNQLHQAGLSARIRPGQRIAITVGSRGVADIALIVRVIIGELRRLDAKPFIVPTMGSHGGATAEGQRDLIAEYGITEEAMGVPILSSMDTVVLGQSPHGATIHMDRNAYGADGVIVVARVKNHTSFRAPIESGLCKMMAIGLGKQRGAESIHAHGLVENIPEAARIIIETGKVVLGVATVEDSYHRPARVVVTPPERIHETDRDLLRLSNRMMPRVPFDELDVLVVDWMGKNISGAGMDSNVVGMWRGSDIPPCPPFYRRVVVLNVTPESHGNCIGIGAADFTTQKLMNQFDAKKSYWNALTANMPEAARIPIVLETDVEAVEAALRSAQPQGGDPRMVRIKNTLDLEEFYVTAPLLDQLRNDPEYEILSDLAPMPSDGQGNLLWG